jgi:hypothetical protein
MLVACDICSAFVGLVTAAAADMVILSGWLVCRDAVVVER